MRLTQWSKILEVNITGFMGFLRINRISTPWLRSNIDEDDLEIILISYHWYNKITISSGLKKHRFLSLLFWGQKPKNWSYEDKIKVLAKLHSFWGWWEGILPPFLQLLEAARISWLLVPSQQYHRWLPLWWPHGPLWCWSHYLPLIRTL